jgi:hypothetical protein
MAKGIVLFFATKDDGAILTGVRVDHRDLCDQNGNSHPVQITKSLTKLSGGPAMYSTTLVFLEYARHCALYASIPADQLPSLELVGSSNTPAASVHGILRKIVSWISCFGFINDGTDPIPSFLSKAIDASRVRDQFVVRLRSTDEGYRYIAPHEIFVELDDHSISGNADALQNLIAKVLPPKMDAWKRNVSAIAEPSPILEQSIPP